MKIFIERETRSGQKKYQKIDGVMKIYVFDDVKARLQINEDCCVRTPVRPKDIEKYTDYDKE